MRRSSYTAPSPPKCLTIDAGELSEELAHDCAIVSPVLLDGALFTYKINPAARDSQGQTVQQHRVPSPRTDSVWQLRGPDHALAPSVGRALSLDFTSDPSGRLGDLLNLTSRRVGTDRPKRGSGRCGCHVGFVR